MFVIMVFIETIIFDLVALPLLVVLTFKVSEKLGRKVFKSLILSSSKKNKENVQNDEEPKD